MLLIKIPGSVERVCMRMRSPRMAPPVNGLLGSTAMTPTEGFSLRYAAARRSTRELFPEPGLPVIPITLACPVCSNSCCSSAFPAGERFSTREIARARARVSPLKKSRAEGGIVSDFSGGHQQFPRNDEALNLACSFAYRAEFDVAIELLGGIILDVAIASVDLNALVGNPNGNLACMELRHGGFQRGFHALVLHPGGAMSQQASAVDIHRHIRQLELNTLECRDRFAELFPLLRVMQGCFEGALCHAQRHGGNADSPAIQYGERIDESVTWLAEQIVFGNTAVVKDDCGSIAGAKSQFVFLLSRRQSWRAFLDDEGRNSVMSGGFVCDGHRNADFSVGSVSGESLLSVQNPVVAIEASGCLCPPGVAARFRFCKTPGAEFLAPREGYRKAPSLFLGAEREDVACAQGIVCGYGDSDGTVHA